MQAKPRNTFRSVDDAARAVDALVDAMVQVMVESGDAATDADLIVRGFAREDIEKHGPAAAAIARGRSVRHIAALSSSGA